MVFLKQFFEKVDFEKNQQTTKSMENYPVCKEFTIKSSVLPMSRNNIHHLRCHCQRTIHIICIVIVKEQSALSLSRNNLHHLHCHCQGNNLDNLRCHCQGTIYIVIVKEII